MCTRARFVCAMPKIASVPREFMFGGEQHASMYLHDASALREVLQRISGNSGRGQGWAERREGQGVTKDISSLTHNCAYKIINSVDI